MAKTPARALVLRPADPFDLIRWLARSQSDPRKAVAEPGAIEQAAHAGVRAHKSAVKAWSTLLYRRKSSIDIV